MSNSLSTIRVEELGGTKEQGDLVRFALLGRIIACEAPERARERKKDPLYNSIPILQYNETTHWKIE